MLATFPGRLPAPGTQAEVAQKTKGSRDGFWSQAAWVQVPALLLPSSLPLSKPVNLSVPYSLISKWDNSSALLRERLWGLKRVYISEHSKDRCVLFVSNTGPSLF